MILHIIPNHRFALSLPARFEIAFPKENRWLIVGDGAPFLVPDSKSIRNVSKESIWGVLRQYTKGEVDLICVHRIDAVNTEIALRLVHDGHKVVPFLWAGEYSGLLSLSPLSQYLPITRDYILSNKRKLRAAYLRMLDCRGGRFSVFLRTIFGEIKVIKMQRSLLDSVDYFVCPVPEEAEMIIRQHKLASRPLPVQYGPLSSEVLDMHVVSSFHATSIQVGHSGWPINNHLDVFDLLKQRHHALGDIVATLAYGSPDYLKDIEKLAFAQFGAQFKPIKEFVPKDQYFKSLRSITTYIAAQKIQFGLGNVKNLLAMGKRIVMPSDNPMFLHLQARGFHLFDYYDSNLELTALDPEVAERNHELAVTYWSERAIFSQYRKSLELAMQPN